MAQAVQNREVQRRIRGWAASALTIGLLGAAAAWAGDAGTASPAKVDAGQAAADAKAAPTKPTVTTTSTPAKSTAGKPAGVASGAKPDAGAPKADTEGTAIAVPHPGDGLVFHATGEQTRADKDARLQEALHNVLHAEALAGTTVGFLVKDLSTGHILAEVAPDTLINPASNMKLFTTAAALHYLKPEYRYRTRYYADGVIKEGVLHGNLVIKGSGDPTVVTERLERVASDLALTGLTRITGAVIVDDFVFDHVREAKGWEQEEAPERAYAAPVGGLSLNFNAVGVHVKPGEKDEPATLTVSPPNEYTTLEGEVESVRWPRRLHLMTRADDKHTLFEVSGSIYYRAQPHLFYRRIYDPGRYFASALIGMLQRRGIRVRHRIIRGHTPARTKLLVVDKSPPLTEIVDDLNKYSNNFIAETLVKTIGAKVSGKQGTFDAGLAAIRSYLKIEVGLDDKSVQMNNGSGLNHVNKVSARALITLLEHMHRSVEAGPEFIGSLGVAGTMGTIRSRMRGSKAERRLRAKTGTLRGVSALSGYVAGPDDRPLAFSILVQGFKPPTRPIWNVQNAIGRALASDGESWFEDERLRKEKEAQEAAEKAVLEAEERAKAKEAAIKAAARKKARAARRARRGQAPKKKAAPKATP